MTPERARHLRWSPMLAGLAERLGMAAALIVLLWLAVAWSLLS